MVVGITGASGTVYGVRLLEVLRDLGVETHLVMTRAARRVAELETGYAVDHIEGLAGVSYANDEIDAPIASGSFRTAGMIVAPCSIKSLSAIANSYNDGLLVRAADVVLKERRKLVLVPRETPLSLVHLRNMALVTEAGATVLPAAPGFYHRPREIAQLVDFVVQRIVDHLGLDVALVPRWGEGDRGAESGKRAARSRPARRRRP